MNTQQEVMMNFLESLEDLIKKTKEELNSDSSSAEKIRVFGRFSSKTKETPPIEEIAKPIEDIKKTKIKSISVETNDKNVMVSSPYNTLFTEEAKILGGRWKDGQWFFDLRDQKEVEDLVFKVYGELYEKQNLVDLEVTYNPGGHHTFRSYSGGDDYIITLFGQKIAAAKGRDSGAKLASGIVLKSGGFGSSGSAKNWYTKAEADTTIVLRDISKQLVDEFLQEGNNAVVIKIVAVNSNVADMKVDNSNEIDLGLLDD